MSASIILTMRYVIAVLALIGPWSRALHFSVHYSVATSPCSINEKWDCDVVNHSSYSLIQGIPVAIIGIAGYLGLVWLGLRASARCSLRQPLWDWHSPFIWRISNATFWACGVLYCCHFAADIALIMVLGFIWLIADAVHRQRRRW